MKLIPCILICFVFGYLVPGICSELNETRVIERVSVEERRIYHCIPTTCPKNSHAILCKATDSANPGKDECFPCGKNTFYPKETNTSTILYHIQVPEYEICRKPDCNCGHEARITNPDECSGSGIAICECDLYEGFCGGDPKTCEKWGGNVTDLTKGIGLTQSFGIKQRTDFVWQKNASLDILKTKTAMDHALNTEIAPKRK